jgi:RNA polymerase sigma-70 factor (ECF subfamily)
LRIGPTIAGKPRQRSTPIGVYRIEGPEACEVASVARSDLYDADEVLIRELYPSLHRFAAAVCPPDVEPDDLLQEALYRVLRRGGLSDIPYPTAYLRRTITNLLAKHWRSAGRRRRAWSRSGVSEPAHPEYPSDLADLLRLQPRARAVLYMRAIEGRPFTEVAEVLGCTEVAARGLEARARKKLRSALVEEAHDATA